MIHNFCMKLTTESYVLGTALYWNRSLYVVRKSKISLQTSVS